MLILTERYQFIGAGKGRRDISHPHLSTKSYFHNKLHKMRREGKEFIVQRLLDSLTFQESRDWERFFIQALGRKDLKTGPLYNLTDGGEGVVNMSDNTKQRMSDTAKIERAKPESKKRMSEVSKMAHTRPEVKLRQSIASKTTMSKQEVREQISKTRKETAAQPDVKKQHCKTMKMVMTQPKVRQHCVKAQRNLIPRRGRCFKGVSASGVKWTAIIDGKYIGIFATPEAAAQAYNDAVDKYWNGEGYKNLI